MCCWLVWESRVQLHHNSMCTFLKVRFLSLDRREGFKSLLSNDLLKCLKLLPMYIVCTFMSNYSPPGFMTSKFDEKDNNKLVLFV